MEEQNTNHRDDYVDQISKLITAARHGSLTPAERGILDDWLAEDPRNQDFYEELTGEAIERELTTFATPDTEAALSRLLVKQTEYHSSSRPNVQTRNVYRRLWPYAAAVAILLAVGTFLFLETRTKRQDVRLAGMEVLPGGNRATLTLADGRVVELSEAHEGIIVGDGSISYHGGSTIWSKDKMSKDEGSATISALKTNYYVLNTPKGGTYAITLPDGSKVWLNAASTLKYPERFDGDERVVELEGEAYFEIRQQKLDNRQQTRAGIASNVSRLSSHQPFKVLTQGQVVEVLGTTFNVSAYADNAEIKTTLVEGKVRASLSNNVIGRQGEVLDPVSYVELAPGQQAVSERNRITQREVDVSQFVSWKSGRFTFDGKTFDQIIQELGRWYNFEIVYESRVPTDRFMGGSYRTDNIETVLRLLESSQIAYEMRKSASGTWQLIIK